MATLKEHQQAMVDLLASGSGIPASASRLAHAMHDVLIYINGDNLPLSSVTGVETVAFRPDATTPGLNDKALAADVEACRPKATPAERRVRELENTCVQLRASNAKLRNEVSALKLTLEFAEAQTTETQFMSEQAGCRKDDTQVCEHAWVEENEYGAPTGVYICTQCGAVKQ